MPGENRDITDPNPPSPQKVINTSIFRLFQSSTVQNSDAKLMSQKSEAHANSAFTKSLIWAKPRRSAWKAEVRNTDRRPPIQMYPLAWYSSCFVFRPSISVTYAIACEQAELSCLGWWRKRVSRQSHARDTKRPQLSWVEVLDESSLVQNSSSLFPANPSSGKAESNKYGALEYEAYNTEHCCNKTEGEALQFSTTYSRLLVQYCVGGTGSICVASITLNE